MNDSLLSAREFFVLLTGGYKNLQSQCEYINSLNVFPIPDGDTGINMLSTLKGGLDNVVLSDDLNQTMLSFSKACLFTARGNSGVIFAQFLRGVSKATEGYSTMSPKLFVEAFKLGAEYAYSAVIKPVEGTMLTVLRECSEFLQENLSKLKTFTSLFNVLLPFAKKSLFNTPNLLPVLKEAGVVDSGGAGLVTFFEGFLNALNGQSVATNYNTKSIPKDKHVLSSKEMQFGYCVEFLLQLMDSKCDLDNFSLNSMTEYLQTIGNSVVVVRDEDIVKVHVHTFEPEKAIGYARKSGELINVKIENMSVQHNNLMNANQTQKIRKKIAVVAVANGDGISSFFKKTGADVIIDGGQTNNPSTNDFIDAYAQIDAEYVVVLPNNKNVLLSARQSASLYTDAQVKVIESKSIAEGYSALSMADYDTTDIDVFLKSMQNSIDKVTTAYVSVAIRDCVSNDLEVKKGKFVGLTGDQILSCDENRVDCFKKLIKSIPEVDEKETLVAFYSDDVGENEIALLEEFLLEEYPLFDVAFIKGGQGVYDYIISLE